MPELVLYGIRRKTAGEAIPRNTEVDVVCLGLTLCPPARQRQTSAVATADWAEQVLQSCWETTTLTRGILTTDSGKSSCNLPRN